MPHVKYHAKPFSLGDAIQCVGQWSKTPVWMAGNPSSPKRCLAYVHPCAPLCPAQCVCAPCTHPQLLHRGCQHRTVPSGQMCSHAALHLAMMQQSSAHHFQEKEHRDTTVSGWTTVPLFYFLVVVFFKPLKRITTAPVTTNIGINIIHMPVNGGITSSFPRNLLKKIYYVTVFFFLFFVL